MNMKIKKIKDEFRIIILRDNGKNYSLTNFLHDYNIDPLNYIKNIMDRTNIRCFRAEIYFKTEEDAQIALKFLESLAVMGKLMSDKNIF